jgi:hypothetical protein
LYQAILDPYRETADLGADIESPEDGLPICRVSLVQTEADVRNLRLVAPEDGRRMFDRLEGIHETAPKKSKIPRPASQDFFHLKAIRPTLSPPPFPIRYGSDWPERLLTYIKNLS